MKPKEDKKNKVYDHKKIETQIQKIWDKNDVYKTEQASKKKKFYVLDMFPYPSGAGLHVGHPRGYIGSDVYARMKRMQGYNVLHPMGYDAFGLPAEQYAIEHKIHPRVAVEKNVKTFEKQLSILGLSYDWSRKVNTTDPSYYKWTQWIFLKIYNSYFDNKKQKAVPIESLIKVFEKQGNKNIDAVTKQDFIFTAKEWASYNKKQKQDILMNYRLAYEGYAEVNWCSNLGTVLANDEVIEKNGKLVSERGEHPVVKKSMRQWFMRITAYADKLISGLDNLDWPENIKDVQRNWIGKSVGSEIKFKLTTNLPLTPSQGRETEPGYITTDVKEYKELYEKAVEMRKNPTKAEEILWKELKSNKQNYHFRRQHIVDHFIVDFLCLSKNLIIEIDGEIHIKQKERDQERTNILEELGYKVLRFSNKEVLENTKNVIQKIVTLLNSLPEAKVLPLGEDLGEVKIFTTRADTLFGATYVVLAPEHKLVSELKNKIQNYKELEKYLQQVTNKTDEERQTNKIKTGVELKGISAINPANGESIPVWVSDYVLASYGTGAVMAVPAHDERDFEFAQKYSLPVKNVINPSDLPAMEIGKLKNIVDGILNGEICYLEKGFLRNSDKFDGLHSNEAKIKITKFVGGKIVTKYKMRDAIFARQRYWGEPIPLAHNKDGLISEVKSKDLPLQLPNVKSYNPTGTGESPLAGVSTWSKAGYETNTMPGWAGSSWYFLRYMDPANSKNLAGEKALKYWKNVDVYVGGAEHATGHLLYARFWHKVLHDLGVVKSDEPFKSLRHQGMIGGADGRKMSKRWGNVINPDDIVKTYGADTLRVYEMFLGPFDSHLPWNTESIMGSRRFIERVWRASLKVLESKSKTNIDVSYALQDLILKVSNDIAEFKFNTAISAMMIFLGLIEDKNCEISNDDFVLFIKLLAPFAPYVADEIYSNFGFKSSIHKNDWPKSKKLKERILMQKIIVQFNGKLRGEVSVLPDTKQEEIVGIINMDDKYRKYFENGELVRTIFIPNKIINFVIKISD